MQTKAIVFDLDDTLYDYSSVHKLALRNVYEVYKTVVDASYDEFVKDYNETKRIVKRSLSGSASSHNRIIYFQKMIEAKHHTVRPEIIMQLYHAYWDYLIDKMTLRTDALEMLKTIKAKCIKTAIVSDLTTYIQTRKIVRLQIGDYIDHLVTSEEAGTDKPHPYIFLLALQKLEVLPDETIMVGDNIKTDIEGANSVGIKSVLLLQGDHDKVSNEKIRQPDFKIKNLSEVMGLIENG